MAAAVSTQSRLALRPPQQAAHGARPPPLTIAAAAVGARPAAAAAAAAPPPTPLLRPHQCRRLVLSPPPAALPSLFGGGGGSPSPAATTSQHPLWSYLGSAVEPLHPEQAALMHRLAFGRRPSATHVVVVFSSGCAACRASEDEVERFASGLMHELRFRQDPSGGGSNGRLRVSSLDVTPRKQRGAAGIGGGGDGGAHRAAEVAGRLLGVEELPTAVMFIEGAPGCIRVGPRWRPDAPALTAERLVRVVNAARERALGGGGGDGETGAAGPPLELIRGAHWPLGRDLLGLPPLWGEESVAALGGAALEEELRRAAVGGGGGGEGQQEQRRGTAARPSEASAAAAANPPPQKQKQQRRQQKQQQQQQTQQPRPTPLSAVAPSAAAGGPYWSRPGKAAFWLGIAGAAALLWAWDALSLQRAFERWQLARRTAARARGVRYSREVNEMDATDVLMDAIERAGAARARAGATRGAAARAAVAGGSGRGRGRGGGGRGGLAAAEAEGSDEAESPSSAAAIDVVATDVPAPQAGRARGERGPPPPPPGADAGSAR